MANIKNIKRMPSPFDKLDPKNDPENKIDRAYIIHKCQRWSDRLNTLFLILWLFTLGSSFELLMLSLVVMTATLSWHFTWKLRMVLEQ